MTDEELLDHMRGKAGWTSDQLAQDVGIGLEILLSQLDRLRDEGLVILSAGGNWRAKGAVRVTPPNPSVESGRRTRQFIYSPNLLLDCPEFTRNTFLHYVGDEFGGFRLRDYHGGQRVKVKQVKDITQAAVLERAYPWHVDEFDEEEAETRRDAIDFWQKRIERLNEAHADLLAKSADLFVE